ncbi:MAG: hypothetical protein ACJA2W_002771 [Planctomycetota bacterium]|jgi:hypothetical protein
MKFDPEYARSRYEPLGEGEWDRWDRTAATRLHVAISLHHLRAAVAGGGGSRLLRGMGFDTLP